MRINKLIIYSLILVYVCGCSVFVKNDPIAFECYRDESMEEKVAEYYFDGDKTVRTVDYQMDPNFKVISKEGMGTYSVKKDDTYIIHGDQDISYQYKGGIFKSTTVDIGYCILMSDVSLN